MSANLPSPSIVKSYVNHSIPRVQAVFFELRELITTPKDRWTPEQKKWWASVNICLGQLESELREQKKVKK